MALPTNLHIPDSQRKTSTATYNGPRSSDHARSTGPLPNVTVRTPSGTLAPAPSGSPFMGGATAAGTAERAAAAAQYFQGLNSGATATAPAGRTTSSPTRRTSGSWGGGSSGGGSVGVDPAVKAAYQALFNEMGFDGAPYDKYLNDLKAAYDPSMIRGAYGDARTGLQGAYADAETKLNAAYDPAKINQRFDVARGAIGDAAQAGYSRMGQIERVMSDRAAAGRADMAGTFSAGDEALDRLGAQYLNKSTADTGRLNDVLANFDAGTVRDEGYANLVNNFAASRLANQGYAGATDRAMADRDMIYGGLRQDVAGGIAKDESGLLGRAAMGELDAVLSQDKELSRLLAQQGISLADALGQLGVGEAGAVTGMATSGAQAQAQGGLSRLQAEEKARQDALKLKAELAAAGIVI